MTKYALYSELQILWYVTSILVLISGIIISFTFNVVVGATLVISQLLLGLFLVANYDSKEISND